MVRNIAVVVLGVAMIMLLPITLRISSSIADPLHQLMSRLSAGSRGDLSVRLEIDSESEVGLLSRYFNEFMEKLEANRRSRITAEEELNKERERFRALAEQSPLGISLIHRDGDYEYINPGLCQNIRLYPKRGEKRPGVVQTGFSPPRGAQKRHAGLVRYPG